MKTEIYLILLILFNIGVVFMFYYMRKIREKEIIKLLINSVDLTKLPTQDCFSQPAKDFYLKVISEPDKFTLTHHTLTHSDLSMSIWVANDVEHRRFYANYQDSQEEIDRKNAGLTYYDKVLFERIAKSFKQRNEKIVTKFFLSED